MCIVDNLQPIEASDYDLQGISTPIRVEVLDALLRDSNYNTLDRNFLITGFREGFDMGYRGPLH